MSSTGSDGDHQIRCLTNPRSRTYRYANHYLQDGAPTNRDEAHVTATCQQCGRPDPKYKGQGLCSRCYQRVKAHGDFESRRRVRQTCTFPGCEAPVKAQGWCDMHWRRILTHGSPEDRRYSQRRSDLTVPDASAAVVLALTAVEAEDLEAILVETTQNRLSVGPARVERARRVLHRLRKQLDGGLERDQPAQPTPSRP